jgi:hypothetical protein
MFDIANIIEGVRLLDESGKIPQKFSIVHGYFLQI